MIIRRKGLLFFFFERGEVIVKQGNNELSVENIKEKNAHPEERKCLFGGGSIFGDSLRAFRNGVLGKFTGKDKADRSLDLAGGDRALLVVSRQLGSFRGNTLEDIVDKGVQDRHGAVGDTRVRVDLLENLVDVGTVGLLAGLGALLLAFTGGSGLLSGLFLLNWGLSGRGLAGGGGLLLSGSFRRHFEIFRRKKGEFLDFRLSLKETRFFNNDGLVLYFREL
jgi:hypothetical protein